MTEALTAAIAFAFDTLHLSAVVIDPIVGNIASEKLAEHFGGVFEGTKRIASFLPKQKVYRITAPLAVNEEESPVRCCRWCGARPLYNVPTG